MKLANNFKCLGSRDKTERGQRSPTWLPIFSTSCIKHLPLPFAPNFTPTFFSNPHSLSSDNASHLSKLSLDGTFFSKTSLSLWKELLNLYALCTTASQYNLLRLYCNCFSVSFLDGQQFVSGDFFFFCISSH